MATERSQVSEIVADWKTGVIGLGDAVERITAALGIEEADIIEDILQAGENDPLEAIVNEIDAEYDLDYEDVRDDFDDDDPDEFDIDDEPEGVEFGGEA